jgi:hypothetical protein
MICKCRVYFARNKIRLQLFDSGFASFLFDRVKDWVPKRILINEEDKNLGPFSAGEWELEEINDLLRFCKYDEGGVFKPHRDGVYMKDEVYL